MDTDVYPLYLRAWRTARACERYTGPESRDAAGQLALALGALDGRAANSLGGDDKFKTRAQVLAEIARHDATPRASLGVYRYPSRLRQRRRYAPLA